MARVVLPIDQPLGPPLDRIAGLQVRADQMARALARAGHAVTVAQSGPTDTTLDGVRIVPFAGLTGTFDAAIATPPVWRLARAGVAAARYVADGYEAPFASFPAHAAVQRRRRPAVADAWYRGVVLDYLAALRDARAVVYANPAQGICYETLWHALGDAGPGHERAADLLMVHSGTAPEGPGPLTDPRLRTIASSGPIVLWAGGVYPWFDLESHLRAIPAIAAAAPAAQFLFAGLGGASRDEPAWTEARVRASEGLGALGERLHFAGWLPYAERGQLYRAAALAVSAHHPGLETRLSMRTRLLDAVWAQTPIVATAGDWLSETLAGAGGAATVAPGDAAGLGDTIAALLASPSRREAMRQALERASGTWLSWDTQIAPLDGWLRRPPDTPAIPASAHATVRVNGRRRESMRAWAARLVDRLRRA